MLCSLFLFLFSGGQDNPYIFTHLNEKDGLSFNNITSILKDRKGMMWIGTDNGLNRFDGSHFKQFRNRDSASGLPVKAFTGLCEDKQGHIWAATENGVQWLDPSTGQMRHYDLTSEIKGTIYNIMCDRDGNIWASGMVLNRFDPVKNTFREVFRMSDNPDSTNYYLVRRKGLLQDPSRKGIWMVNRKGLYYFDIATNRITTFFDAPGLAGATITTIAPSGGNKIWLVDSKNLRLIQWDTRQNRTVRIDSLPGIRGAVNVNAVFEDQQGRVWMSSWTNEVFVYESKARQLIRLNHQADDPLSIAADFFWAAMEDDDGTVWLGTSAGLSKTNPGKNVYRFLGLPRSIPELEKTSISIVTKDPLNNSLWLATLSWKLINTDPATGRSRVIDVQNGKPDQYGRTPGGIYSIRFYKDLIIICTTNGTWQMKRSGILEPLKITPPGYDGTRVVDFHYDGDSVVYLLGSHILMKWNTRTNETKEFLNDKNIRPNGYRPAFEYFYWNPALKQNPWMSSGNGTLSEISNGDLTIHRMVSDSVMLKTGYTMGLSLDNEGNTWAAFYGVGIFRIDGRTKTSRYWHEQDGLVNPYIQKLIADDDNRIWCAASNKVSVFDPKTSTFFNTTIPKAENHTNYFNSLCKLTNGHILLSVYNDVIELYPERLGLKPKASNPTISLINVSGKDYLPGEGKPLSLEPDQNSIRFSYGILTDRSIFPYDVEYRLENFEDKWVRGPAEDEAVYNNLKPGNYVFHIRAKGRNMRWQSTEASFAFIIKTPYYSTWWFRMLMLALIIISIWTIYKYRLAQKEQLMKLENRAQMLEKEKATVMYESLKQQLNPHFLFNSLTSLSSLIVTSPPSAKEFLENLSKSYRYILKSRDHELVPLSEEIRFAENYIMLQKTRFENGFDIIIQVPEEYHHRKIVPVTLQNLIENAIKHNIIDPEAPLKIEIFNAGDYLVVRNNLQKKNFVESSNRVGLANMQSFYQYLSNVKLEIIETPDHFIVKIPLI